jgi:predicted outer membrane lipoprotein
VLWSAFGSGADSWLTLQRLLYAAAGAGVVGLAVADVAGRRDADSALLALWLLGVLVFASFFNWVTNARSILPMAPAFGILLVRRLEQREQRFGPARGVALAAGVLVALWVTIADYRWANDVRDSARELAARHVAPGHRTYFLGNWGLQYYLEQAGATPVDQQRWPQRGDRLIVAENNTDRRAPPEALARLLELLEGRQPRGMRTLSRGIAGFYASAIGPLPYAFAPGAPDRYRVWQLEHPVRFTPSW